MIKMLRRMFYVLFVCVTTLRLRFAAEDTGCVWEWESPWSGISSSCLAVGRSSRMGQRSRWHPSLAGPELSGSSPPTAPYWDTHTHTRKPANSIRLSHAHKTGMKGRRHTDVPKYSMRPRQDRPTRRNTHLCRLYTHIMAWEVLCLWRKEQPK